MVRFALMLALLGAHQAAAGEPIAFAIKEILPAASRPASTTDERWLTKRLREVYIRRNYSPLWHEPDGRRSSRAMLALKRLEKVAAEGLDPRRYTSPRMALPEHLSPRTVAADDVQITADLLVYARDVFRGQVAPVPAVADFCSDGPSANTAPASFSSADSWSDMAVEAPGPEHRGYRDLMAALARYREIEAAGGWRKLPAGPFLEYGVRSEAVAQLRKRLEAEQVALPAEGPREFFDAALEEAVKVAQERYGLKVDGIVGPQTRRALNVPVEKRVRLIAANMERWRWLPRELGETHLLVNIPAFRFALMERDKAVLTGLVVVGRPSRPTPQFNSRITRLVINPDWVVPPTILKRDVLPKVRKDPTYPTCAGLEVLSDWGADAKQVDPQSVDWAKVKPNCIPFKFRQPPGRTIPSGGLNFLCPTRSTSICTIPTTRTCSTNPGVPSAQGA
jgi:murein L,D-transpeptidase YcbB/YkuD